MLSQNAKILFLYIFFNRLFIEGHFNIFFRFSFYFFYLENKSKKYSCDLCKWMFFLCFFIGILRLQVLHLGF